MAPAAASGALLGAVMTAGEAGLSLGVSTHDEGVGRHLGDAGGRGGSCATTR